MGNILFYNAQTESKIFSLHRVFTELALPGTGLEVEMVEAQSFREKLTPEVELLVLPGARASSAYREQLSGANLDHLSRRVEDGLQVLGICAGAYVLSRHFEYFDYSDETGHLREHRVIDNQHLGLAPLRAYGPDLRLYPPRPPRDEANPWTVYTDVAVTFNAQGKQQEVALAISKGPSFTHLSPKHCRPFALYKETGETAMAQFAYGQGGGLLCGPSLEVGGENLAHYMHPDRLADPRFRGIITRLEASQQAWSQLWGEVFSTLLPRRPAECAKIRQNMMRF